MPEVCSFIGEAEALREFATFSGPTQSQRHIKPLHYYVACRLVLEGGFLPEDLTPRPPFVARKSGGQWLLEYDQSVATGGEWTILGGLKTKDVDVVATKQGHGPVLAVSCKGMTGAFRNLTNRMEETVGECTNLHITYPALVCGYMFVIRANKGEAVDLSAMEKNNLALDKLGKPVESILRFHTALKEMTGRRGIREDVSRYEAIALALVKPDGRNAGANLDDFPSTESPLRSEKFFAALYQQYDERFVFTAPSLRTVTDRRIWSAKSPAFVGTSGANLAESTLGYEIRRE